MRIEWHHDQPFVETDAVVIDPGRRALDCQVDYYGTTFAPPATARDIAVARLNHAVWLTWEP